MTRKTWISCAPLLLVLVACTKSETATNAGKGIATRDCDPLSVDAELIALGEIIAAGKAADGTVYVLDRGPALAGMRGFVSEGKALRRRNVIGSGEGEGFVVATLDDPQGQLQVRVELAGAAVSKMGVSRGEVDPKTKSFEITEPLTLLAASNLSGFQLVNISAVSVTYAATTTDGHRFFVFEPKIDRSDEKLRAFYGTQDRVVERQVLSVARTRGFTMFVELDLEGVRTKATLNFCQSQTPGATRLEPAGGPTIALTPVPGSPGAMTCPTFEPDADGGGIDAGAASVPADAATLTSGLRFVCF